MAFLIPAPRWLALFLSMVVAQSVNARDFTSCGTFSTYTVPETGRYLLDASGAQGGTLPDNSRTGGWGARIRGYADLTAGDELRIAVGCAGKQGIADGNYVSGGGGGGASSIVKVVDASAVEPEDRYEILVIAGGGGGAGKDFSGGAGQSGPDGQYANGGKDGNGGSVDGDDQYGGAAGGGFHTDGGSHSGNSNGGRSYINGNNGGYGRAGASDGGWGGGGEAGPVNNALIGGHNGGGGGGGGYSGGAGGPSAKSGGGGGGSFFSALTAVVPVAGARSGNGLVRINPVSSAWLDAGEDYWFTQLFRFPDALELNETVSLGGSAVSDVTTTPYVRLTQSAQGQSGGLLLRPLPPQLIKDLKVSFKVRLTDGTAPPADGFSFNFGPQIDVVDLGAGGVSEGLSVRFDSFDNSSDCAGGGACDSAPAVEVVYDGVVIGGVSFDGVRADGAAPAYDLATDPESGQYLALTTGQEPAQVVVVLTANAETSGGAVTVVWNGVEILSKVSVPYVRAAGWDIGFGASTGGFYQEQSVADVVVQANAAVSVTVVSEYGEELVAPRQGSGLYAAGTTVTFDAPEFVYLDRYRKALSGSNKERRSLAHYRARLIGGSSNGQSIEPGATIELTENLIVIWRWSLEYLALIDAGTDSVEGLAASAVTPEVDQLGRNWRPQGYNFSSVVYAGIEGDGVKFQPAGYVIENAHSPPERSLQLSGSGDHLYSQAPVGDLIGVDGSFSLEFWVRRESTEVSAEQTLVELASADDAHVLAGFNASGAFAVSDSVNAVVAPVALSDHSWHHWAVVSDMTADTVTLYRDGRVVAGPQSPALNLSGTASIMVGARQQEDGGSAEAFFAGGLNNLRIWRTALSKAKVRSARSQHLIGAGNAALALELPFDLLPQLSSGVYIERRRGTAEPDSVADTETFALEDASIQAGFTLPDESSVPAADAATGYYGWTLRSQLQIERAGIYRFWMTAGDGGRLLIDGRPMGFVDVQNAEAQPLEEALFLDEGNHTVEVSVFDKGGRSLTLQYASQDASLERQDFALSTLRLTARDQLFLGGAQMVSTEGGGIQFEPRNFAAIFPTNKAGAGIAAAVLPGFHFRELPSTAGGTQNIDPAEQGELSDYVGVYWLWDKVFPFQIDVLAMGAPESMLSEITELPYLDAGSGNNDGSTTEKTPLGGGVVTVQKKWIPAGDSLSFGTAFRTQDRRYTFQSVSGALGNFGPFDIGSLRNTDRDGAVAKGATITNVSDSGRIQLNYAPTRFRARLGIGESLDLSSMAALNLQLTPDLPDGAALVALTANVKPSVTPPDLLLDEPGWSAGNGDPWQWDVPGRKFYPLKPGTFVVELKDRNTLETYHLEVVADFPDVRRDFSFWEEENGDYQGEAPDYVTTHTFAPTDAQVFPAAPGAHYRYLVSPQPASPMPVDLDPANVDRWKFLRLGFSEQNTAAVDTSAAIGPRFTETSANSRSVLVFSFLPTSGIAVGDPARENVAVRVVTSLPAFDEAGQPINYQDGEPQIVASRIRGEVWDTAGYGSGYILNEVSNYNAFLYDRTAAVGQWGPVYPVNWSGLFTAETGRRLSIGYYENPGADQGSSLHPPVGWPHVMVHYDTVDFPPQATAPVIYIASQLGSEGYGQDLAVPQPQLVFDPAVYADLAVYNQPDRAQPGFNPNEEHALVAPSNLALMTGDDGLNIGQSAFFALQNQINRTDRGELGSYTSEPFVLAQFTDRTTGERDMRAYLVRTTRGVDEMGGLLTSEDDPTITTPLDFFPARDPATHLMKNAAGDPITQPANPAYTFDKLIFAGQLVEPIYPLNRVTGGLQLALNVGDNLGLMFPVNGERVPQQTLWRDKNRTPWAVAGDVDGNPGQFEYRFWYPLEQSFWLGENSDAVVTGRPVCWLPEDPAHLGSYTATTCVPQATRYSAYWQENYPVLKRGETLSNGGGEHQAEHPLAPGLPAVVGWASAEIVFDSATPGMVIDEDNRAEYTARFERLLDVQDAAYTADAMPDGLSPENPDRVSVEGTRWYFNDLYGSLNRRFYFDNTLSQLIVRGRLNGYESGSPDLAASPMEPTVLEPSRLSSSDVTALSELGSGSSEWSSAIGELYAKTNYNRAETYTDDEGEEHAVPAGIVVPLGLEVAAVDAGGSVRYRPLRSLGTGATLVPNPAALAWPVGQATYVTLVENNHPDASGAVTLHVVRLGDERFRGSIAVLTPRNAFDEKVQLKHTGDFGGDTAEIYYQWWVHDIAPLDGLATPDDAAATGWLPYAQGTGLDAISFQGRPDVTLSDKLFYVRYGYAAELSAAEDAAGYNPAPPGETNENVTSGSVHDSAWHLVSSGSATADWTSPLNDAAVAVPYQWAGAANSPQLQPSGVYTYVPQLLMGWVKRVLDAVTPYEARYSEDFSGDAPATFSSMLMEAGAPYRGPCALNAEKDYIESVGLICVYETVARRAAELSAGQPANPGINQARLLAHTRLKTLYELFASEAYADAQNGSLSLASYSGDTSDALIAANPYVFAFMNQEPTLLQEELGLLRGTDHPYAYPVQNRIYPNYFRGLGEAAYNVNYNISDINNDGVINESDALTLYPAGHGDAWGWYLAAAKQHYELLRSSNFDWQARPELYARQGNVVEVDFLDEQSFARSAATRVKVGVSVVKATYRDAFVLDPDGQTQGYTDTADPERAFGVVEWANRAGQSGVFDWMVGNAILPLDAVDSQTGEPLEGLARLERGTTEADLATLALSVRELQSEIDGIDGGLTPLGLDQDAVRFGLDPFFDGTAGSGWQRKTHFEQTYDAALAAARNARQALDYVSTASQNLRVIADDTQLLKEQAIKTDLAYRDRLILLLGTPYEGTIGPGKIFKEGYTGPDTVTYMYLAANSVEQVLPQGPFENGTSGAYRNVRLRVSREHCETAGDEVGCAAQSDNLPQISLAGTQGGGLSFADVEGLSTIDSSAIRGLFESFYLLDEKSDGATNFGGEKRAYDAVYLESSCEPTEDDVERLCVEIPIATASSFAFTAPTEWGQRQAPGKIQSGINRVLRAEVELASAIEDYNSYLDILQNRATQAEARLIKIFASQQWRREFVRTGKALALQSASLSAVETLLKATGRVIQSRSDNAIMALPTVVGLASDVFAPLRAAIDTAAGSLTGLVGRLASGASIAQTFSEYEAKLNAFANSNNLAGYQEFTDLVELMKSISDELLDERGYRFAIASALEQQVGSRMLLRREVAEAQRALVERAAYNKMIAARAQRNRYADMAIRQSRDEAARKYEEAMDNALRYAWLAAQSYDYETSLSPGHPANPRPLLEALQRERQLGQWDGDEPKVGNNGIAEALAKVKTNFDALKGDLGLNNPQWETNTFSLRTEALRIRPDGDDANARWKSYLSSARVADLNRDSDFTRRCRPFAANDGLPQPGFKIIFSTEISSGRNFFGRELGPLDQAYSSANFNTRIRSVGVNLVDYDVALDGQQELAATPRVYLVPLGLDYMRYSDQQEPRVRAWKVVNQRIPVPFPLNISDLSELAYQSSVNGLTGTSASLVRMGDFRAVPTVSGAPAGIDPAYTDSALFSRSVWNDKWALFIPAASMRGDQDFALDRFIQTVTDIRLELTTFSASGM